MTMLAAKLTQKAMDKKLLTALKIELLYKCNLDCVHCYVGDKKAESYPPYLEQYIDVLKQAKKLGVYDIAITGGEPFMYKYWKELFLIIKNMNFNLTVFTNATYFNETDICYLKEIGIDLLRISRYGLTKETYEKSTRRKGSYDKFTKNIELIKKYKIPHNFSNIVLSTNEEEAFEMMSLGGQTELNIISDYNRTKAPLAYRPSMETLKKCHDIRDSEINVNIFDGSINIGNSICNAGMMSLSIACNGDIFPCSHYRIKIGNILNDSLEDVWDSLELVQAREKLDIKYFRKCLDCIYKGYMDVCCPGENYCATGDFYDPPEYKCEICKYKYESKELSK